MRLTPWHFVAGAILLGGLTVTAKTTLEPRGIRNRNPLNIERGSDQWQGMAPDQTDERFIVFVDPRYGYRAGARIIASYRRRGLKTLAQIVNAWAPPVENNTGAYIGHMARAVGIDPDTVVTDGHLVRLFAAMTLHENGKNPYSIDLIEEGISWA